MVAKITDLDFDNIIKLYKSGVSILKIAETKNVSRGVITRALDERGIKRRSMTQAQFARYKNKPESYKKNITKKAIKARRGMKDSIESLKKRAKGRKDRIGRHELDIIKRLKDLGFNCVSQYPFGKYNIDIFIEEMFIAIEIYGAYPKRDRVADIKHRAEHILNCGVNLVNVQFSYPNGMFSINRICEQIGSFFDFCSRNQSIIGHYFVIRGNGKIATPPCHKLDNFTAIERL